MHVVALSKKFVNVVKNSCKFVVNFNIYGKQFWVSTIFSLVTFWKVRKSKVYFVNFAAGCVFSKPGKSEGKHNTRHYLFEIQPIFSNKHCGQLRVV